jgi:hypothetical protein
MLRDPGSEQTNVGSGATVESASTNTKTKVVAVVAVTVESNKPSETVQSVASNAAAKTASAAQKAGDTPTNLLAGAKAETPKSTTEKPISSYKYLAEFASDKVPESVATEDEATNNTWRVYCLKASSSSALKVEEGKYVPGYATAKGGVGARVYIGQKQNSGWKTDYTWILFENTKLGKGYLYQLPSAEKAVRIHLPFKCGEHDVDASILAGLHPSMLNAINQTRCVEVWVLVGDSDDLTAKVHDKETQMSLTNNRLKVKYEAKEVDAVLEKHTSLQCEQAKNYNLLREKIREVEKVIAEEIKQRDAEAGEVAKLKRFKTEIDTYDADIKNKEDERENLKQGNETEEKKKHREQVDRQIKDARDNRFNRKNAIERELKFKFEEIDAAITAQQNKVTALEKGLNAHCDKLKQQEKAVVDTLADLKKGKLPMSVTVILDKPDKTESQK